MNTCTVEQYCQELRNILKDEPGTFEVDVIGDEAIIFSSQDTILNLQTKFKNGKKECRVAQSETLDKWYLAFKTNPKLRVVGHPLISHQLIEG